MAKSMAKNAVFNVAYKALSVVFPLITISYASRILGPSGIGIVNSAQNLVTYFVMFASLGVPAYGVRTIAQNKNKPLLCNKVFTELFVINLVSTLICSVAYFVFVFLFCEYRPVLQLNILFGTLVLFNIFNLDWLYQAYEEYKYIAIRSFIIKLLSLILLVIIVRKPSDLFSYSIIVCFGTVGNYVFDMVKLKNYVKFDFKNINVYKHLKPIFVFFASVIAIELYSLVDVTMLTYMTTSEHVGYYANASKIVRCIAGTITAIGAVLMPRLSLYFSEKRNSEFKIAVSKTFKIILILTVPSCLGIILTAKKIVPIMFGEEFLPAINTLCVLSPLVIFIPLSGGVGAQILQTTNNEKLCFVSVCSGAIVNIILNAIFIPIIQENGAAAASVITEGVVTIMMLVFSKKIVKVDMNVRYIVSIILASFLMFVSVTLCDVLLSGLPMLFYLILEVAIGIVVYFLILFITKNDVIKEIFNMFKNKMKK